MNISGPPFCILVRSYVTTFLMVYAFDKYVSTVYELSSNEVSTIISREKPKQLSLQTFTSSPKEKSKPSSLQKSQTLTQKNT